MPSLCDRKVVKPLASVLGAQRWPEEIAPQPHEAVDGDFRSQRIGRPGVVMAVCKLKTELIYAVRPEECRVSSDGRKILNIVVRRARWRAQSSERSSRSFAVGVGQAAENLI